MWDRYFRRGRIFGIDIDPRCAQFERGRIKVAIGSQADREFLKSAFGGVVFNVILDDASHVNTLTKASFESLFDRLAPGGLYIIEDLACSYVKLQSEFNVREIWPGMKYNACDIPLDNDRSVLENMFGTLIHDLDRRSGAVRIRPLLVASRRHRKGRLIDWLVATSGCGDAQTLGELAVDYATGLQGSGQPGAGAGIRVGVHLQNENLPRAVDAQIDAGIVAAAQQAKGPERGFGDPLQPAPARRRRGSEPAWPDLRGLPCPIWLDT